MNSVLSDGLRTYEVAEMEVRHREGSWYVVGIVNGIVFAAWCDDERRPRVERATCVLVAEYRRVMEDDHGRSAA